MPRAPRLDFAGACHHVMARGNRGQSVFMDADDSRTFLRLLTEARDRFSWRVLAYCLLPDQYQLAIETPQGGLARGMRHLNGTYTQAVNRKYRTKGHLFEGRYKAVLIDKDAYLPDLIRYIALCPVRTGLTDRAEIWRWGSYRDIVSARNHGDREIVASDGVLALFGQVRSDACQSLRKFVEDGIVQDEKTAVLEKELSRRAVLGSEMYVASISHLLGGGSEVPAGGPQIALSDFQAEEADPKTAMARAYLEGGHTLAVIAEAFGVHESTVSRAVAKHEAARVERP